MYSSILLYYTISLYIELCYIIPLKSAKAAAVSAAAAAAALALLLSVQAPTYRAIPL